MGLKVLGVIPARFGSTRLPAKVLADIHGKPMVVRVFEAARRASLLSDLIVATDSDEVADCCKKWRVPAVLTYRGHETGSDRVAEVARNIPAARYVNIQADEPMVDPAVIDAAVRLHAEGCAAVNVCSPLTERENYSPNCVKAFILLDSDQIWDFQRAAAHETVNARRQLGLYVFSYDALMVFRSHAPQERELSERVEMLRLLDHGVRIHGLTVDHNSIAVDTPDDLERVREAMKAAA
jgi:3-deoxy-manno-octulosonate cytidylyltransferase (CMP-KDO synthetase)